MRHLLTCMVVATCILLSREVARAQEANAVPPAVLVEHLSELAGPRAADCGVAGYFAQREAGTLCMKAADESMRPFYFVQASQRDRANAWTGWVRTSDARVFVMWFPGERFRPDAPWEMECIGFSVDFGPHGILDAGCPLKRLP